ncbi:uridylate kinase [Quercus suber]|uniref:UMP kinase n=1 Tax=Quercus suber TaxID=58331 RepID=A0AAW0M4T9_QUESU
MAPPSVLFQTITLCQLRAIIGAIHLKENTRQSQMSSMAPFGVTMNEGVMSKSSYKWRRVLLKVSGEALAGDHLQNIDPKVTMSIAREVAAVTRLGIESWQGWSVMTHELKILSFNVHDLFESDISENLQSQMSSMAPFGVTMNEGVMSKSSYKWRRVLLKVSGEALAGDHLQNIDPKVTMSIAREVAAVTRLGIEVAIVVGGGNIFRGSSWAGCSGLDRSSADYIGMLATVMNAIFLQATMESIGIPTRVQTAFRMSEVAEPYIRRRAVRHLEKGRVVIFAAGTGNPFFTTDTAAALRCAETTMESIGIPTRVQTAFRMSEVAEPYIRRRAVRHLEKGRVVIFAAGTGNPFFTTDTAAALRCAEIVVFNLGEPGNISKAIKGERVGTLIGGTHNSPVTRT